jgi:hypothetical protein
MKNTSLMRVPNNFKKEVFRIAKKRNQSAVKLLKNSGCSLLQNADYLTDFITGLGGNKKSKK